MNRDLSDAGVVPCEGSAGESAYPQIVGENRVLRRQVEHMLGEARHNASLLRRFQSLELDLLGCESLASLLALLMHDAPTRFAWDRVALLLHDPEHEIRSLLQQVDGERAWLRDVVFVDTPARLDTLHGENATPRLGPYLPECHAGLFGLPGASVASVALLPLRRQGRLFGSYMLGSPDPARFPRDAGSDFLHHLGAVIAACVEIAVARDRLQHLGLADALTGVNNRRFFDQRLPEEVARALRAGVPLSCLFIDVDHFKQFNDRYGHQAGDRALRAVAHAMRTLLRRSDIVARYGGEEFAVLLPEANDDEAALISERLRKRIASARFTVGGERTAAVTVSIGVATLKPDRGERKTADLGARLVAAADRGVYRAKRDGRNRVVLQPLA